MKCQHVKNKHKQIPITIIFFFQIGYNQIAFKKWINNNHTPIVSLVTLRFCLALVTWLALIIIMLLIVTLFLVGNENRMDEMSTHCFGFAKLHFHLLTQQSWYNFLSFFTHFFFSTHHWIWTCLEFLDCSSFTTSFSILPIHIRYNFKSIGTRRNLILFHPYTLYCPIWLHFNYIWPS